MKKEDIQDTTQETASATAEKVTLVKVKHKVTGQEFTVSSDSIYATSPSYTKVK